MKRRSLLPLAALCLSLSACDGSSGPFNEAGIYTDSFVFDLEDAAQAGNFLSVEYDAPYITRDVLEEGAVLLYFREFDTWTAMPYTYGVESETDPLVDYTVTLGYGYDLHTLEVFYETSADPAELDLDDDIPMKIVVINARPSGKNAPDLNDYEAVRAFYGLAE